MTTKQQAIKFIEQQDTGHCRTLREAAKYLTAKLTPYQTPHPAVWWEVLKIAQGLTK